LRVGRQRLLASDVASREVGPDDVIDLRPVLMNLSFCPISLSDDALRHLDNGALNILWRGLRGFVARRTACRELVPFANHEVGHIIHAFMEGFLASLAIQASILKL